MSGGPLVRTSGSTLGMSGCTPISGARHRNQEPAGARSTVPGTARRCTEIPMKVEQIFPTLMIALSFAAAIVYAFDRNWRQTIYWTAAAIITITVTY